MMATFHTTLRGFRGRTTDRLARRADSCIGCQANGRRRRCTSSTPRCALADHRSLHRFAEHEVVLPLAVIAELEGKRNHPELGWSARQSLRTLELLRTEHGSLTAPLPVNDEGGTLRVELNHQDVNGLPAAFRTDSNDHRILAVARSIANEGRSVTLVTKDLPLRLKASIVGLTADEYRNELATDTG